jgi:hypothetical protein
MLGHTGPIYKLAGWQGKALSGSEDMSIRAWNGRTGEQEATLTGHDGAVQGLAVHRDRLFSASNDCMIRSWALGTWVALQTVDAFRQGTRLCWLEALDLQHTLLQPAGAIVWTLLAVDGLSWGAMWLYGDAGLEVCRGGRFGCAEAAPAAAAVNQCREPVVLLCASIDEGRCLLVYIMQPCLRGVGYSWDPFTGRCDLN